MVQDISIRKRARYVPIHVVFVAAALFVCTEQAIPQPVIRDAETEWGMSGTRWARLARPLLVSWQHAPYAGTLDASGVRLRYFPQTSEPGFVIGLHQTLGGRAREIQLPRGSSVSAFRSSEVQLLARSTNDDPGEIPPDYEVLAAWSGIVENDPRRNILTTMRFRGGYRGMFGETEAAGGHQIFAEALLATNTVALGMSSLYYGAEGDRGIYGPRVVRLYAGLLGYYQIDPEATTGVEPFAGIDGMWEISFRRLALLYGAEVRTDQELFEWSARAGLKLGQWAMDGLSLDVTLRGSDESSPDVGIGIGYELSR